MGDPIKFMVNQGKDFKAGDAPQQPQESMDSMLRAYVSNLPGMYNASAQAAPGLALGDLAASQATAGGYNQLALQQMQQYGLPMAQINKSIDDTTNPEYAANRALTATRTADLLNSINLNGLSGGEQAAVERSLNQSNYATGNLGVDNATNAVSNAMQYGDRMAGKRAELGSALNSANQFAGTKFGAPATPLNTGAAGNNTSQALGFGQSALGSLSGVQQNQSNLLSEYNWRNSDRWAASDIGKNMSSMCCFILLEATNGNLPWYVRQERNYYYRMNPSLAIGYKRMAKWLVPLMRKSNLIKWIVNATMVKPLTAVGGYDHLVNNSGKHMRIVKHFWFSIWRNYGIA